MGTSADFITTYMSGLLMPPERGHECATRSSLNVGGVTPRYTKVYDSTKEQEKQTTKIKRTVGRLQSALRL